jgi:hypothetical protein
MNTIEKTTTTAQSSAITDNPDGTFDLHGEVADRVRAEATARGITPAAYADLAIQRGLEIMEERSKATTPIEIDADLVAKVRASWHAVRPDRTMEDLTTEFLADTIEPDSGFFSCYIDEDDARRDEIEAELKRIRES